MTSVDWPGLRRNALEAMGRAYAPYSQFPVGAAALVDDGRVVVGCNVENASYGLTLCAECGLVSALHATGGGRLVAFACVDSHGSVLMPCGRCRQLLWEHGGPDLLVDTVEGTEADDRTAAVAVRRRGSQWLNRSTRSTSSAPSATGASSRDEQIDWVISAYTRGVVADEQMAALAMAVLLRGLSAAELARWTAAMIASGERLDLSGVRRPDD